ncbi:MAG: sulfite exporter TauE/SafE family protein [Ignavibacteriae bacterium]|nr:sulfite exporter TauE/SafE family protein [Ignavibacteriota bacterium]
MVIEFFLLAVISEILGTIAGFGSSTVFLPLALLFFDFPTALILVAIFHIFGNLARLTFFKSGIDRTILVQFGLPSVMMTVLGALLVSYLPQATLKGLLGIFLLLFGIGNLLKKVPAITPTIFRLVVSGGVSGFLAGLIGTGGALRGAALQAFGIPKTKYIATAATIALAVDATRIPIYFSEGFLQAQEVWYLPLLLAAAVIGSLIGKKVVDKVPQHRYKVLLSVAIALAGLLFVVDWLL